LVATLAVATLRFDLDVSISPWVLLAIPLVSAGSVAIGYRIAYTVKPVLVGLITNIFMVAALMFGS
jgi:ABC-2 type transport system permease protein